MAYIPYIWVRQMAIAFRVMTREAAAGLRSLSVFPMLSNVLLTLVMWDKLGKSGTVLWHEFTQQSVDPGMIGDFSCLLA